MKQGASALLIAAVALALGGCGETRLTDMLSGGKPSAAGNMQVQTNQNLAMPPDLRLPQPGAASSEAQVATYDPPADDSMTNENLVEQGLPDDQPAAAPAQGAVKTAAPAQPAGDIYDRYGISKTRPDGTKKSDGELQAELKKAYLAKKRQSEPGYGTIWNVGAIFKDG